MRFSAPLSAYFRSQSVFYPPLRQIRLTAEKGLVSHLQHKPLSFFRKAFSLPTATLFLRDEHNFIQKRIKNCLGQIIVPDNVFSGVKGKSYADNARFHVGNNRRNLYKIDLTAFFPSITRDTVYHFFAEDLLCSPDVAQLLTDLTTIDLGKSSAKNIDEIYEFLKRKNVSSYNHLISGAPTSQMLSYLVNHQMFDEMQKLADDNGITMTVYVDDVTFSSENRISKNFRDKIIAIIRKYNYQISRKKVKRYTKLYPTVQISKPQE